MRRAALPNIAVWVSMGLSVSIRMTLNRLDFFEPTSTSTISKVQMRLVIKAQSCKAYLIKHIHADLSITRKCTLYLMLLLR